MKITIITVFPEFYDSFLKTSIIARAIENNIISVNFIKFSDMCNVKERIDVPTCGPGAGMVIKPEIVQAAIEKAEGDFGPGYKIFFSPKGEALTQKLLKELASMCLDTNFAEQNSLGTNGLKNSQALHKATNVSFAPSDPSGSYRGGHIILLCARYEGFDARTEQTYANKIISIGNYVVMGGDLPAQVFLEGFLRFIPGVVGNQESVQKDSYSGSFLDYPAYSLPKVWNNLAVPEILFSGDHAKIEKWRQEQAAQETIKKNFDWFITSNPDKKDIELAKKFIPNHYVVLMHSQVNVACTGKDNVNNTCVGHTSITSLDIHDIARSSATYGIKNYFLVSALLDQQKILKTFLDFWMSHEGQDYNISRFEAVSRIITALNFDEVVAKIREQEGVEPIIITTSAKESNLGNTGPKVIDYNCQGEIFAQKRPVLFVFGTGQGLSDEVLNKSNYLLLPIKGLTDYNHLSVRSAAAIILDRWLGLKNKIK